jgi:hypothetical protein
MKNPDNTHNIPRYINTIIKFPPETSNIYPVREGPIAPTNKAISRKNQTENPSLI